MYSLHTYTLCYWYGTIVLLLISFFLTFAWFFSYITCGFANIQVKQMSVLRWTQTRDTSRSACFEWWKSFLKYKYSSFKLQTYFVYTYFILFFVLIYLPANDGLPTLSLYSTVPCLTFSFINLSKSFIVILKVDFDFWLKLQTVNAIYQKLYIETQLYYSIILFNLTSNSGT